MLERRRRVGLMILCAGILGLPAMIWSRGAVVGSSEREQPIAEDVCCGEITQGEFALELAWALGLAEPPEGWTAERAMEELARLGRHPERGWHAAAPLREADLGLLLRGTRFARMPAAQPGWGAVTRARVRAIFRDGMPITHGGFARLLAEVLAPSRAFTEEQAIAWLRARGLAPSAGWEPEEWMTEAVMWEVLSRAGWPASAYASIIPEAGTLLVDRLRAQAIVRQRRDVLTQAMLALLLVKLAELPPPEGGWTLAAALAELERWNVRPEYGWTPSAPVCQDDFARLLRRVGLFLEPADRCRVAAAPVGERIDRSAVALAEALSPTPQVARLVETPIFAPLQTTALIVPLSPNIVSRNIVMPVAPVPPEIVGSEIPSRYSVSRPGPGF